MHFAISSNVASVWCVNGRTVSGDCERVIDDALSKRLTLQKGPNTVNCARVKKRQNHRTLRPLAWFGRESQMYFSNTQPTPAREHTAG
jgi:hypothetical protein